jgi:simple sugar transport system substrate-binding protein
LSQAEQAATDLGVELKMDLLEPPDDKHVLYAKMASRILSLCREGVNGIFVTIPSQDVIFAIKECQALNIPVISINSGAQEAMNLGLLHHISQLEYTAGREAGNRMIDSGMKTGACIAIQNREIAH